MGVRYMSQPRQSQGARSAVQVLSKERSHIPVAEYKREGMERARGRRGEKNTYLHRGKQEVGYTLTDLNFSWLTPGEKKEKIIFREKVFIFIFNFLFDDFFLFVFPPFYLLYFT
jgi:hypothetical protein